MDVNRIYGVHTERVQPLQRVARAEFPTFEDMREDVARHYSNRAEEEKRQRQNRSNFFHQNYKQSRFRQTIQPYGFKENTFVAMENCIYVNHLTVKQMIAYAANHDDFFWDDMGFDGNVKWVVVKNQRFECKFTNEEIACYEQMFEGTIYTQYLQKQPEHEVRMHVLVTQNRETQLQFMRLGNSVEHKKIQCLQQNTLACKFIQNVMQVYQLNEMVFML